MIQATLYRRALALAVCLTLPAAAIAQPGKITSKPLNAPVAPVGDTMFTQLDAAHTGIDMANRIDWDNARKWLYMHSYAGSGVCVGDYDNDGKPDVYLTGQVQRDRLYRQVGDMVFEDVTDKAGVNLGNAWGTGATFLDIDNDGDLDLYVCNYDAPNLLYINQGNGTFVEGAKHAGLDFNGASVMAAVTDYDHDGYLDIYLLTNRLYPGAELDQPKMQRDASGHVTVAPDQDELFTEQTRRINGHDERYVIKAGQRDRLYHNNGNGTFTEVGEKAGITGNHPGLSATWWDYDGDGWADLYVGNDFWDPDRWYRNNGDGTFTDIVGQTVPHTPWFSMGADFGDINNDGRMDFLAADMSARTHFMSKLWMGDMGDSRWFLLSAEPRQYMHNMLYLNTGTPRFMEIGFLAGLASTDWTWSVLFNDLDNDGRIDFFATNGTTNHSFDPDLTRQLQALENDLDQRGVKDPQQRWEAQWQKYRQVPPTRESNTAFRNDGDYHFSDTSADWGVNQNTLSYGAAMADLDRDGDLDLIVCNIDDPISVYRNGSTNGHRILISLQGTRDNRFGIGAQINITTKSTRQMRQVFTTHGFESATEPVTSFGLGDETTVEQLTVTWPDGNRQEFRDLPADQWYTITQPGDKPTAMPPVVSAAPMFKLINASSNLKTPAVHERVFEEYDKQPLIPAKLSQNGPGLAWGDADGDGDDDLYVGAPAGQSGKLFLDDGAGRYTRVSQDVWTADRECEDMAALWIDVDGDGDQDLIVASGSDEKPEGDVTLRDRLYLNDGHAHFSRAPVDAISDAATSTSTIVAADYDHDGDLDLFIGGRTVPDHYPLAPHSRLLRNDHGRFTDVTQSDAPGLADSGMVTAAVWSDVNDDGWVDLLIAREYGSIACWINTGSGLVDRTSQTGLSDLTGWWNSIAVGDVDNDGDMDYVVLNAGLNTKYKTATPEKPAMVYYGDFDGNGQGDIVEAKSGSEHVLLPVRGLSCSSEAMPVVKQRMPTYHDFAGATLDQIYTPQTLADALVLDAKQLASGVLINEGAASDGTPRFTFKLFDRIAQASPGYGAVVSDLNGDGAADIYFVQNFSFREPETGRWDGGLSQLLLGDGHGNFTPIMPDRSGLLVPGDGRGLAISDIDHDGRPDVTLTQNEESIEAFLNNTGGNFLEVRLRGKSGNPTAVGARVRIISPDEVEHQSTEVAAGSGYLSQSAARIYFGLGEGAGKSVQIQVRWPDGTTTTHVANSSARRIFITQH